MGDPNFPATQHLCNPCQRRETFPATQHLCNLRQRRENFPATQHLCNPCQRRENFPATRHLCNLHQRRENSPATRKIFIRRAPAHSCSSKPLPFQIPFLTEKETLSYTLDRKWCPFYIPKEYNASLFLIFHLNT